MRSREDVLGIKPLVEGEKLESERPTVRFVNDRASGRDQDGSLTLERERPGARPVSRPAFTGLGWCGSKFPTPSHCWG